MGLRTPLGKGTSGDARDLARRGEQDHRRYFRPGREAQSPCVGCDRARCRRTGEKQDGAALMRFEIAYGKAFAALALNRSSQQVLQKAKEKPAFMQSLAELADGPLFLEGGGQLIRDATGEIVGALGVTGDVNEIDDLCAINGIHAGGFSADADFDAKAARRLNIKRDPPLRDPRKR